jgi:hypothetical protein
MYKNYRMRRKIPLFKVRLKPGGQYSQLNNIPEVKDAIFLETISAIKHGIEKRKSSVYLFEIADSDFYIELKKDQWKSSLERAMEYFVEKEEYNKCAELRDLINLVKL